MYCEYCKLHIVQLWKEIYCTCVYIHKESHQGTGLPGSGGGVCGVVRVTAQCDYMCVWVGG